MSNSEHARPMRLHIGNISQNLMQKSQTFETRLEKYGKLSGPLEFHTKPVADFYFAFADMELTEPGFKKLRQALNGVLFMGRKISIAEAKKGNYHTEWAKDAARGDASSKRIRKQAGIAASRDARIAEQCTVLPSNAITKAPMVNMGIIGANNQSMGYHKSAHTFCDMSANTKTTAPSHSLIGLQSYGSTLVPKGPYLQHYSRNSGHGDVVKGRMRKTPRPKAHFIRKEQTLRILINGELKNIKGFKTKLWGVENSKSALDLTYRFVDGAWRSGDDHIVERYSQAPSMVHRCMEPIRCGISAEEAQVYGQESDKAKAVNQNAVNQNAVNQNSVNQNSVNQNSTNQNAANQNSANQNAAMDNQVVDSNLEEDFQKNSSVLASLFSNFDFDQKVDLENDVPSDHEPIKYDSKGRRAFEAFDYETKGSLALSDTESETAHDDAQLLVEEYRQTHERPADPVYYSEGDSDMEIDDFGAKYTTEAIKEKYDEDHREENYTIEVIKEECDRKESEELEKELKEESEELEKESKEEREGSEEESEEESEGELEKESEEELEKESEEELEKESEELEEESEEESVSEGSGEEEVSKEESESEVSEKEEEEDSKKVPESEDSEEDHSKDESSEIHLIPSFAPKNTTENLRSLFNEGPKSFGFGELANDVENDQEAQEAERKKILEQIEQKKKENEESDAKAAPSRQVGLFWNHANSAFLQTQTQLSKMGSSAKNIHLPGESDAFDDKDAYEKWFYSMRGEVNRQCKKRKREVTKAMRKRPHPAV